jgi:RimJ/RimL family protein N-acetyltransferase
MIETERLILRPFEADDIDIIFQIYSDSETLHYTPFDPMSREQAEQHLHRIIEEGKHVPCLSYELAVVLKESGEKIGRTHILIDPETDTGMIGWLLLKEHRGKHYAAEMTGVLLSYCFDELGLHRANAVCSPENTASWKVLEKAGMRREALLKQKCRYVKNGVTSWQDELEYAILASEYRALKNSRFSDIVQNKEQRRTE